jgi:hypothetical protein
MLHYVELPRPRFELRAKILQLLCKRNQRQRLVIQQLNIGAETAGPPPSSESRPRSSGSMQLPFAGDQPVVGRHQCQCFRAEELELFFKAQG